MSPLLIACRDLLSVGGRMAREKERDRTEIAENSKHHCTRVSVNKIDDITVTISLL